MMPCAVLMEKLKGQLLVDNYFLANVHDVPPPPCVYLTPSAIWLN